MTILNPWGLTSKAVREMNIILSMATKGLLACLCFFALVSSVVPQVSGATENQQYAEAARYGSAYDAVQDQRMTAVEANITALQKSSETQQKEIEQLIEAQSKWTGGLQTLLGLIGFTSVVSLGIQIFEKWQKNKDK
jgi:hypothetical protein